MKPDLPLLWSPDAPGGTGGSGTPGGPESDAAPQTNPSGTDSAADRLLDLTTDHALGQLTPDQVAEMNALLAEHPELAPDEAASLEEAAALLAVAELSRVPELDVPAGLREKLTQDAEAFFTQPASQGANDPDVTFPAPDLPDKKPSTQVVLAFIGGGLIGGLAAAVLVALLLGDPASKPQPPLLVLPTPDERFALYQQNTPGIAEFDWAVRHDGYDAVGGRVAWSDETQTGFMVLDNLPANDPARAQYQLWIVDPARDAFPVDGGVFNVAEFVADDGKAYVPIDAKLPVQAPAAFAITLEQPGGVVKSNNPLLVVAPTTTTPS